MIKYYRPLEIIVEKLKEKGYFVKKGELEAVHDDDLVNLLKSLELYYDVINEQCTCNFCGATITLENIQGIVPINGKIAICCDSQACYDALLKRG